MTDWDDPEQAVEGFKTVAMLSGPMAFNRLGNRLNIINNEGYKQYIKVGRSAKAATAAKTDNFIKVLNDKIAPTNYYGTVVDELRVAPKLRADVDFKNVNFPVTNSARTAKVSGKPDTKDKSFVSYLDYGLKSNTQQANLNDTAPFEFIKSEPNKYGMYEFAKRYKNRKGEDEVRYGSMNSNDFNKYSKNIQANKEGGKVIMLDRKETNFIEEYISSAQTGKFDWGKAGDLALRVTPYLVNRAMGDSRQGMLDEVYAKNEEGRVNVEDFRFTPTDLVAAPVEGISFADRTRMETDFSDKIKTIATSDLNANIIQNNLASIAKGKNTQQINALDVKKIEEGKRTALSVDQSNLQARNQANAGFASLSYKSAVRDKANELEAFRKWKQGKLDLATENRSNDTQFMASIRDTIFYNKEKNEYYKGQEDIASNITAQRERRQKFSLYRDYVANAENLTPQQKQHRDQLFIELGGKADGSI